MVTFDPISLASLSKMSYMPVRGGTRGGKDQFEWDDVKADKHRENYLGHSLMAPVGRWQKGKDLTWYNKKSKVMGQKEILRAEIAAVKKAEEEAMATALGLKPKTLGSGTVSKEELAEVCRRQSVEEKEEAGEERMKGLGYMSRRLSHLNSNQTAATGAAMFESKPVHEGETRSSRVEADSLQPQIPPPSSHPPTKSVWVERTSDSIPTHRSKERKKKTKKEKSEKKHRRKHRKHRHNGSSSESESEEDTSRDRRRRRAARSDSEEGGSGRGRRRNEVESDSDSEERRRRKRRKRKREGTESNDDRGRKRKGEGTESDDDRGRRGKTQSGREGEKRKGEGIESDDDRGRRRGKTQSGREGEKRRREPSSESEDDDAGQTRHRHHHGGEKRTHKVPTRHRHDSSSD